MGRTALHSYLEFVNQNNWNWFGKVCRQFSVTNYQEQFYFILLFFKLIWKFKIFYEI